jgi:biotin carboxylase
MDNKKTLLIISGGIEAIPGIRKAQELGLHVVVSDGNSQAPGFAFADDTIIASTYDAEATWKAVQEYQQSNRRIDGVICVAADVPYTVAYIADKLKSAGIPLQSALLSMDKLAMKEKFREQGIPIPWFCQVKSAEEVTNHFKQHNELIIKPVDSRGARGVQRVNQQSNIDEAFAEAKENSPSGRVMIEEFLSGHQISTESVIFNELESTPGFSDRNYEFIEKFAPHIIENGGTMPSTLCKSDREAISDLAIAAGRALGVTRGTVKGDMILTPEGPKIIELATRLSGGWFATNQITLATGIDLVKMAIRIAINEPIEVPEKYPVCNYGVAIRYFFPIPGRVVSISDSANLLKQDWVCKYDLYVKVGDTIESVTNHTKRAGYVIAIGKDRAEAVQRAEQIAQNIEIRTQ